MRKLLTLAGATVATASLLVGGVATSAGAETIHRNGAKKVTITADTTKKVPAGAKVTKKRVTVKKGKKTVAKNKKRYRAKKGKYKVTSFVTYRFPSSSTWVPGTTTTGPATTTTTPASHQDRRCRVRRGPRASTSTPHAPGGQGPDRSGHRVHD